MYPCLLDKFSSYFCQKLPIHTEKCSLFNEKKFLKASLITSIEILVQGKILI